MLFSSNKVEAALQINAVFFQPVVVVCWKKNVLALYMFNSKLTF